MGLRRSAKESQREYLSTVGLPWLKTDALRHDFTRLLFAIMASAGRRQQVQELRRLAKEYDVERVADNANKEKVTGVVDALRDCELGEEDESTLDAAWAAYLATFGPSEPVAAPDEPDETRWKFKAGQLTYNSTVGDWASRSKDTLGALFTRLVAFIKSALSSHSQPW